MKHFLTMLDLDADQLRSMLQEAAEMKQAHLEGRRTPLLADLKPGGRYVAVDLDRAGGVPLLVGRLIAARLVDGQQITPSGRTIGEEASKDELSN